MEVVNPPGPSGAREGRRSRSENGVRFTYAIELCPSRAEIIAVAEVKLATPRLGAVCTEMGELQAGQDWFEKAVERGASPDSGDQELRKIFQRADVSLKASLKEFLLAQDGVRFAWVLK